MNIQFRENTGISSYAIELDRIDQAIVNKDKTKILVKIEVNENVKLTDNFSYKTLVDLSARIKSLGIDSAIEINAKNSILSMPEIESLIGLESDVEKNNSILVVKSGIYDEYSLNELLAADQSIRMFVEELKSHQLSPFENYLRIYDFLTQKVYKEANDNEHYRARDIISVINGNEIVCVGYAQMMKRLCNEVGIKCETQVSSVYNKKGAFIGGHENNSVYIKDDKYGIDGWFYADACWDSVTKGKEYIKTYNFCLLPIGDKDKLKNEVVKMDKCSGASALYNEDFEIDGFSGLINDKKRQEIKFKSGEMAIDLVYDDKKIESAYNNLLALLKMHRVPSDIYSRCDGKQVPKECEMGVLFAQTLLCNEKEVESGIKKLKSIPTEGIEGINYSKVKNIYNELEKQLSEYKNKLYVKKENFTGNYEDNKEYGQLLKELIIAKLSGDDEEDINKNMAKVQSRMQKHITVEKVRKDEVEYLCPNEFKSVSEQLQLLVLKEIKNKIKADSKTIPIEAFSSALKVVYKAEGTPDNALDFSVKRSIDATVKRSDRAFDSADNCFSKELNKERERGL